MKVNYVDELNTFMRYARSNALTGRERLLWIALFTIANERATYNAMTKEYDWPGGFFPVPNGELGLQSTLDKRGIETVRNSLKQRGLIDFQPGQKKKPPEYRMNYLSVGIGYKIVPNDVPNNVPNRVPNDAPIRVPNDVPNRVPNSAPLYIDINKIQVTDEDSDAEYFNNSHHHHLRAGESGAGKSTLTAKLLGLGYRFLADDMAVVEISGTDGIWVYPAFPYMKLCRDAVLRQGYVPEELLYMDEKKDKFLVPCREAFQREKVRLKRFVFLGIQPEEGFGKLRIEKVTGSDSMLVYKENLFLRHLWKKQRPEMENEIWQNCLKMAEQIPVYSVKRPAAGDSTAEVTAEVHALQRPCQLKNSSGSSEGCGG